MEVAHPPKHETDIGTTLQLCQLKPIRKPCIPVIPNGFPAADWGGLGSESTYTAFDTRLERSSANQISHVLKDSHPSQFKTNLNPAVMMPNPTPRLLSLATILLTLLFSNAAKTSACTTTFYTEPQGCCPPIAAHTATSNLDCRGCELKIETVAFACFAPCPTTTPVDAMATETVFACESSV